jgi:tetratricopeptide (TPR) repeat protein
MSRILLLCLFVSLFIPRATPGQETAVAGYSRALDSSEKLLAAGDLDAVINLLTPWTEKGARCTEARHTLGLAYYQKKDFANSIKHLSLAVKQETPGSASWKQTVEILAFSYHFSNRPRDALPLLETAAKWNAGKTDLLYTLAMTFLHTGDPENARKTFSGLFGVAPENAQAYLLTADLMLQERLGNDAEALLRSLQEKYSNLPGVEFRLGLVRMMKGDYIQAAQLFQKELAVAPANVSAWQLLGEGFLRAGKLQEALDALQRSVWLDNRAARSYLLMGNVYLQQGRMLVAENTLKRAIELDPLSHEAYFLLGRLYHKTNRSELAAEAMASAEKLRPMLQGPR